MQAISLKKRIIGAAFAMTFVTCAIFTVGLFTAFELAEESLFEDYLEQDLNTFIEQYRLYPGILELPRSNFSVYLVQDDDTSTLPDYIRNELPDVDDVERDGKMLDIEIKQDGNKTFYFVIEETAMNQFENFLLASVIIIVLIICVASTILAFLLSNRISKPVTELADRVNNLERSETEQLQATISDDEIEVLSSAVDSFQARVSELLRREREFSSDASHELRTPLMSIQAAAENLKIAAADDERIMDLAGRIESKCEYMRSLVEAMLFLARDPDSLENDFTNLQLENVVSEQIETAAPHTSNRGIEIRIIKDGNPVIHSTNAILSIVFGNLLRNAIIHSESEAIEVTLLATGFCLQDFGQGISTDMIDRMFERYTNGNTDTNQGIGIGLSLVKRLCDHFDWDLQVDSKQGVGTSITVDFRQSLQK